MSFAFALTIPSSTMNRAPTCSLAWPTSVTLAATTPRPRAAWTRLMSLILEQRIKQIGSYDPSNTDRFVDRLIDGFTPELFDRLAGAGDDTRQPVFVFGMPHSGTTLVEQVLASHSRVHAWHGEIRSGPSDYSCPSPRVLGQTDEMACPV